MTIPITNTVTNAAAVTIMNIMSTTMNAAAVIMNITSMTTNAAADTIIMRKNTNAIVERATVVLVATSIMNRMKIKRKKPPYCWVRR